MSISCFTLALAGVLYARPPTPEKPSGIESLAGRFRTAGTPNHSRVRARVRVRVRARAWPIASAPPVRPIIITADDES